MMTRRSVAVSVACAVGLGLAAAPGWADTPMPQGTTAWLLPSESKKPRWDGFYMRLKGDRLKIVFANALESDCAKATLTKDFANLRFSGYADPIIVPTVFSHEPGRLSVTTTRGKVTQTNVYTQATLKKAKRQLGKGRSANMSAKSMFSTC